MSKHIHPPHAQFIHVQWLWHATDQFIHTSANYLALQACENEVVFDHEDMTSMHLKKFFHNNKVRRSSLIDCYRGIPEASSFHEVC